MQSTNGTRAHLTPYLIDSKQFQASPFKVLDGGSRHGVEACWQVYGDQAKIFAFEPDKSECRRLNSDQTRAQGNCVTHYPVALGLSEGNVDLHVAAFPDSSSMLRTNHQFVDRFAMAGYLTQVRTVKVATTSIDSFVADQGIGYLDVIKLDIEGAELAALEGASKTLAQAALFVGLEVWFQQEHVGRPLFGDIDAYLRGLGFALFDLRDLARWRRKTKCGDSYAKWVDSGQLMYANALYFRDVPSRVPNSSQALTGVQILKLASLAEIFGYSDFAIEVIQSAVASDVLSVDCATPLLELLRRPNLSQLKRWTGPLRNIVRALVPQRVRTLARSIITD